MNWKVITFSRKTRKCWPEQFLWSKQRNKIISLWHVTVWLRCTPGFQTVSSRPNWFANGMSYWAPFLVKLRRTPSNQFEFWSGASVIGSLARKCQTLNRLMRFTATFLSFNIGIFLTYFQSPLSPLYHLPSLLNRFELLWKFQRLQWKTI